MEFSRYSFTLVFGILGNIISFFVGLAPMPTFIRIYKTKTSDGYQCIPYVISLLSAMLWIYYAMVKKNLVIMITINTFSLVIQIFYISFYLFYSSMKQKTLTIKLVVLVDVLAFALVFFPTHFLLDGKKRVQFLGYICMIFSLCVFIAPLAMIRRVVKTKTSEFMSFSLSFFLTLSAVTWFVYGVLLKDLNIALPNVLGFIFGWVQMVVYWVYKKPGTKPPGNVQEIDAEHVVDVVRDGDTIIIDENIKGDTEQMMESI